MKGAPARGLTVGQVAARQSQTGVPITVTGRVSRLSAAPAFALHMADVAADPETGKVTILHCTAFVGWGLSEEYIWENGAIRNPTLLDYRMPIALNLPFIDCVILEVPAPATLANAIYAATGKRFNQLPMSPEAIWHGLKYLDGVKP